MGAHPRPAFVALAEDQTIRELDGAGEGIDQERPISLIDWSSPGPSPPTTVVDPQTIRYRTWCCRWSRATRRRVRCDLGGSHLPRRRSCVSVKRNPLVIVFLAQDQDSMIHHYVSGRRFSAPLAKKEWTV